MEVFFGGERRGVLSGFGKNEGFLEDLWKGGVAGRNLGRKDRKKVWKKRKR